MNSATSNDGYQWKKLGSVARPSIPGLTQTATPPPADPDQEEFATGRTQGYEEGKAAALAEHRAASAALQHMLAEVQRLREQTLAEAMQDIAIALHTIFQQVFHYELRTSPELIQALVDELRQALQSDATPKIALSHQDYSALREIVPPGLEDALVVDEGLPAGVVRASAGKSMLELDVAANMEQVLAAAIADPDAAGFEAPSDTQSETVDDSKPLA